MLASLLRREARRSQGDLEALARGQRFFYLHRFTLCCCMLFTTLRCQPPPHSHLERPIINPIFLEYNILVPERHGRRQDTAPAPSPLTLEALRSQDTAPAPPSYVGSGVGWSVGGGVGWYVGSGVTLGALRSQDTPPAPSPLALAALRGGQRSGLTNLEARSWSCSWS